MDFQNINRLNVRLNMLSGNLLPMTGDDSLFPAAWRIHSVVVWLFQVVQTIAIIFGVMHVPKDKAWRDATVGFLVIVEIFFLAGRMHANRDLVSRLIRNLDDVLRIQDETMRNIVRSSLKPVEAPLKFYWTAGMGSMIIWSCIPLTLIVKRKEFFYEDYRVPVMFSKQPFSTNIFLLGSFIGFIAHLYIFTRKVAFDVYMINLVLLMTAQYRYISTKLTTIFREGIQQNGRNEYNKSRKRNFNINLWAETEVKTLCRHHHDVIYMTSMLKKLLSLNFSLIYLSNVFRFCFIGIMLINTITSSILIEGVMVSMYLIGGLVQLYILCLCVQQLLDASMEITDEAFHEEWYHFRPSMKRTFLLMIIANNLECKLSTFGNFNLSLPSFMTILNQSYSIALLFLRMK